MIRKHSWCVFIAVILLIAAGCGKAPEKPETGQPPQPKDVSEKPGEPPETPEQPAETTWEQIKAAGDALLAQKDYPGAIKKYRSVPPEKIEAEDLGDIIEAAVYNVREAANADNKAEMAIAVALIAEGKFDEAISLIDEIEKRYPASEFPIELRRCADKRAECSLAERTLRAQLFAIIKGEGEDAMTARYGITFDESQLLSEGANVKYRYALGEEKLLVILNADKKSGEETVTYSFRLPLAPPRKCEDFAGVEFNLAGPEKATAKITLTCGEITYQIDLPELGGKARIPFDAFTQTGGIGQTRTTIDSVAIEIQFSRDPSEEKEYTVEIGDIRLFGE